MALEVLIATDAAKNIIRNRGAFHLRNVITTGSKFGMISMDQSINGLLAEGAISPEVAAAVMTNY